MLQIKKMQTLGYEKIDYNMSESTILKWVICFCTLRQKDEKREKLICVTLVLFLPLISYKIFL